jgi:hypothetical protein
LYVVRNGYAFRHLQAATQTDDERERTDEETVLRFLSDELAKGVKPYSQRTLSDRRERVGLSRDRLRSIVHRLLETSRLIERREPGKSNELIPATLAGSIGEGA